ncbi:MAG: hypothetical protein NTW78_03080 [Campylobacterales bacterium]|nr:hypothetical protein [Campylobacterales bacterium]
MKEIEKQLIEIPLAFQAGKYENVFQDKNNKTLHETISSQKYKFLESKVRQIYTQDLDSKLGDFLLKLKVAGDEFYKEFLNKYGDLEYSIFSLQDTKQHNLKGVYFYYINDELKYIGRCKDSMKTRVNSGYGNISPKNCFIDGQSTNCKVNALVTKYKESIVLKIFSMSEVKEIEELENQLICEIEPEWNNRK